LVCWGIRKDHTERQLWVARPFLPFLSSFQHKWLPNPGSNMSKYGSHGRVAWPFSEHFYLPNCLAVGLVPAEGTASGQLALLHT
jgi:hypothetical protein